MGADGGSCGSRRVNVSRVEDVLEKEVPPAAPTRARARKESKGRVRGERTTAERAREENQSTRAGRADGGGVSERRAACGDARAAAKSLDELVVIAPLEDDEEARVFADSVGARFTTVSGPSDIPDAMRRVLD